ncbi:glycosyltransferase family 2 protein, partial [Escherichia coli]|uniref:glycosyltransferase family 2 protein n=1 Tax=Escherichia coli TaxID=562 RepID=UPI001CDB0EB2
MNENEHEIVSIIMPAYNAEATIKSSVYSVIGQTFSKFKLYIINDASTDCTEEIIRSFEDSRIVYIKNDYGNDSNLLIVFYVQIMPDD